MQAPPSVAGERSRIGLRAHLSDPLYRTSYLLLAGSGATSLLGFVFWAAAARTYPPHVVGISAAAISAMVLLSGVCQLGLNTVLPRFVPAAGAHARELVLRCYSVTVSLSLVGGIVVALTAPLWSPSLGFIAHHALWVVGFTLATMCWTVFTLQDAVMTGLQAPQWVPVENSIYAVLKLVLLVAIAGAAPLAGPFIAWSAPLGIAVVLITALIFKRLLASTRRQPTGVAPTRRELVRTAAGNYAATLCGLGVMYLTPVIVADVTNPTQAAYFYAPWTILNALMLVASSTSTSLMVEGSLDEAQLGELFRRCLSYTLRLLVPLIAVVELGASLILELFRNSYAQQGAGLLRILALAALPNVIVTLGLAVTRVRNRGATLVMIQAAEFVPLLALSIVLLNSQGIDGVGWAFLISQSAVAVVLLATTLRPYLARRPDGVSA
jgi:O-antigen/teichoic acid export membrane protein